MSVTNYLSPTVCNFITGADDPGVTPVYGYKGDIFARKWAGVPALFQKQDDGITNNWTQISGGGGGSGTPNTFAGFNGGGNLYTVPGFVIDTVGGGMYETLTEQPNNGGGFTANQFNVNFEPLQNSPNENWNIQSIVAFLDHNNSGFSQGTAGSLGQLLNLGYIHQGSGDVGQLNHININDSLGNGINPITIGGINFVALNANIAANVTLNNQIQGFSFVVNYNAATIAGASYNSQAFFDGMQAGCAINSHVSFNAQPNIFAVNNNSNYSGISCNPNIATLIGNASFTGVGVNPAITTMGANGNVNGFFFNPQVTTMGAAGSYTGLSLYGNITTSHGNVSGILISPQILGGDANYTGISLNPGGGATLPQIIGMSINLSGINSTTQKIGLDVQDGKFQVQSNYHTDILPPSPGFVNLIGLSSEYWIKPGFPVTNTAVFANASQQNAIFEDDMGPDAFGGFIGYAANPQFTQTAVALGKTVDVFNQFILGASVPDVSGFGIIDGGTISSATIINNLGFVPGGGTVVIDNLYGYRIASVFGTFATNAWGLFDESTAENHLNKLAIDTTTKKVSNADVALEIGSPKAFMPGQVTTVQKLALTALAGMVVYDTTLNQLSYYNGVGWVDL